MDPILAKRPSSELTIAPAIATPPAPAPKLAPPPLAPASPKAPSAFETLNTTHLAQLASTAIESARVTMSMPLRPGLAYLPVGGPEQLEINIPHGSTTTISAEVAASPDGPVLKSASVRFTPGFVINNLSALDNRMRVRIGQHFVTATLEGISVSASGKPTIEGTLEHPLGTDPLAQHAPQPPNIETHLLRYLDGSARPPAAPGMPAPDPHELIKALTGIVSKGEFDASLTSKRVIAGVELDTKSPGVRNGGVGIKNDNGKFTFNACGLDNVKDAATALAPFVGNSVQCDGQVNASIKGTVSVAAQGGFDLSISEVAATVTGTGAKLSGDKLSVTLPAGTATTLKNQKIDVKIDGI